MFNLLGAAEGAIPLVAVDKDGLETFRKGASGLANNLIELQMFSAAFGTAALLSNGDGKLEQVLVGLDKAPVDLRNTVHLFAKLSETLPTGAYKADSGFDGHDGEQMAIGWGLGTYQFTRYLEDAEGEAANFVIPDGVSQISVENQLTSVFLARDLINTPAADMGPEELCAHATEISQELGGELTIIKGETIEKEFPAVYAVGKGSHREPTLIDLRWGDENHPRVTLVGKGVVFDSGGLDIKPAAGMLLMKKDMGGAAVTLSLARLIMAEKLPVRLRLLIPAVENAVGPEAFRPGDVVSTRKGLTVEIGNTDAEGRMILCDAIALALEEEPDLLIDMATLTGACRVALGQDLPGIYSPNDGLAAELTKAGKEVADPVWHMPLWEPYTRLLNSKIADLNNISSTPMGGSVTAALFLHQFVQPYTNWLHMDIYGWRTDKISGTPKGGEASALRATFKMLQNKYC